MKTSAASTPTYHFSFPALDTLVLVEERAGAVWILASRDTFSETRRLSFVRALAAEGFIPDEYRWLDGSPANQAGPVRWLVDAASFLPGPARLLQIRRCMCALLAGAGLAWLIELGTLLAWFR